MSFASLVAGLMLHYKENLIQDIDLKVKDVKIDESKKDFILDIFSYQPCLICPFISRCSETSNDQFNPNVCPWLTEWIYASLDGKVYQVNFEELQTETLE